MTHRFCTAAGLACAMLLVSPQLAAAQTRDQNAQACTQGSPDVMIGGCSALIQSGQESVQVTAFAYNNRGNAYNLKGDYDRAIADFDQAIQLNPQLAQAYSDRGGAYYAKRDYDRAIADYGQAVLLNPQYADVYYNRANAYLENRDYDHALADVDHYIALAPSDAEGAALRAKIVAARGRPAG